MSDMKDMTAIKNTWTTPPNSETQPCLVDDYLLNQGMPPVLLQVVHQQVRYTLN